MHRLALAPALGVVLILANAAGAAPALQSSVGHRTLAAGPFAGNAANGLLAAARGENPPSATAYGTTPQIVPRSAPTATDGTWRSHPCADCFAVLAVAPDGGVWGGGFAGGLTRWEPRDGSWRQYTTADGLSGDAVWNVAVDSRGGVWAFLREGHFPDWSPLALAHFDGTRWTHYTPANGLPNLDIVDLDADPAGGMWAVVAGAGAAHFDGRSWTRVTTADGLASDSVQQMAVAPDGTTWFATSAGLSRRQAGRWDTFVGPGDSVLSMAVDRAGVVWVAVQSGAGVHRFDGTTWRAFTTADGLWSDAVYQLAVDGAGGVWALSGSGPSALSRFDGSRWVNMPLPPERAEAFARALAAGPDGSIYVGTPFQGGLARLRDGAWSNHRAADSPDAQTVFSVAIDPADRAWFLPFEDSPVYSLLRHEPGGWRTVRGPGRQPSGLFLSRGIAADTAGGIWHGDGANQMARFDGTAWRTWGTADGVPDGRAQHVAVDGAGRTWVATSVGAGRWDGTTWRRFTTADGLASDDVRAILVDRAGDAYFGTNGAGVSRWDGTRWTTYTAAHGLGSNTVRALAMDRSGRVWAADPYGISRLDGGRWSTYPSPAGAGVTDPGSFVGLAVDGRGRVWHAVGDTGVARFDGGTWTLFNHTNGLLSDAAFDVTVDGRDHVWVATLLGVNEFVPDAAPPTPTPDPGGPCVCALVRRAVPPAVLNDAVANPARYAGWRQPLDPGKPLGPLNPPRTCLSLSNPGVPYHALWNGPVWRAGCP